MDGYEALKLLRNVIKQHVETENDTKLAEKMSRIADNIEYAVIGAGYPSFD